MDLEEDIIALEDTEAEEYGEEEEEGDVDEEEDAAHPADSLIIKKAEDRLVAAKEVEASVAMPRLLGVTERQASESGELAGELPSTSTSSGATGKRSQPSPEGQSRAGRVASSASESRNLQLKSTPALVKSASKRSRPLTEGERQAMGGREASERTAAKPSQLATSSSRDAASRKRQRLAEQDGQDKARAVPSSTGTSKDDGDLDAVAMRSGNASPSSSGGLLEEGDGEDDEEPMPAPIGVTVIEDDEEEVQTFMQRILRKSRYFTAKKDFGESSKKCFNCGQLGHFSRDCPNGRAERPCYLCAKFGHPSHQCPHSGPRCFKCGGNGHISRDCPNSNSQARQMIDSRVCVRCGDPQCAASNAPDYVRAEGGCTGEISAADMRLAVCQDCGHRGHFGCKPVKADPALTYCFNCGMKGHQGTQCQQPVTDEIRREKMERHDRQPTRSSGRSDRSAGSANRSEPRFSFWDHDDRDSTGRAAREASNQHTRFQVDFSAPAAGITYNHVAPPPPPYTPPGYAPPQHPNGLSGFGTYGQGTYGQGYPTPEQMVYPQEPPSWAEQLGPQHHEQPWYNIRQ